MDKQESTKLLRKLALATMESILSPEEEQNCPVEVLGKESDMLFKILMAAAVISPHLLAHVVMYAYEAGKEYSEEEYLKKMFQN